VTAGVAVAAGAGLPGAAGGGLTAGNSASFATALQRRITIEQAASLEHKRRSHMPYISSCMRPRYVRRLLQVTKVMRGCRNTRMCAGT
jgi:hypothetical protein